MKIKIKDGSENYTARVVKIENFHKHPNADRLWIITVFGQNVITTVTPTKGDLAVFFPALSQIDKDFVHEMNGFRDAELNKNVNMQGMFGKEARVRAIKLRGEISEGYLHPLKDVESFLGVTLKEGDSFNCVGDLEFCVKYEKPVIQRERKLSVPKVKKERKSILVDGQFQFHTDTANLRYNTHQIHPDDCISVSYKLHGSSFSVANILTKKKLGFLSRIVLKLGVPVKTTEHSIIYASRRVIKNKNTGGFYKEDIWKIAMDRLKDVIPKGYTLYGEIVGYTPSGSPIQSMSGKAYDYGCRVGEMELYIYRIRVNNEDGTSHEFSTDQIKQFCEKYDLKYPPLFYYGQAKHFLPIDTDENWQERFVKILEQNYNEKDCFMCKNKLSEEGIVVRKENVFRYEAYKLKSKRFLLGESSEQDNATENIEDSN